MTAVIESDYLSALTMRSDWFFIVLVTFWQIIHCSLQTKTNKKCVLWQRNPTMPLWNSLDVQRHRAVLPAIARSCYMHISRLSLPSCTLHAKSK